MPKPEGNEPEEGSSTEYPIVIAGVAASDFAALLKVLYASLFSSDQPTPEASLIIPAFRMANMFNFSQLHAYLLPLAEKHLGDVDTIVFAREFNIKQWLVPAYIRLCLRVERLSVEEAIKLEVHSVLMISHMREQYRSQGSTAAPTNYYCYACTDNPVESIVSKTPRPVAHHPEFYLDDSLIIIEIENTLFKVHKYQLVKSEVFSDMFKMPKTKDNEPEEGSSPEHPIVISGVAASDFTALLKVLYASLFSSNQPAPEAGLIIPAFRMANMFNFSELHTYLLPLAEKHLGDVDKIVFAREFDIKEWLAPAYTRLCQREERLSVEEAIKLEVRSVLMISHMREQYRTRGDTTTSGHYYCRACISIQHTDRNCDQCHSAPGTLYLCGPSTTGPKTNTNNNAIELEVKKWVDTTYNTTN
ncbi:unnamed protein product [Rhizoctonia solani]|uniref:BTB domain-containing protein n=1 Tax=Rhizoctonia solani TaxID=456999 RepID=A0A8H3CLQ0_9AGAM|nr:unnamed protein product [Rhizoctonia solani]